MGTDNKGIDYGLGRTNIHEKTGIRFGVISQNEVLQAWADNSEAYYHFACPHCGNDLPGEDLDGLQQIQNREDDLIFCPDCEHELTEDDFYFIEPSSFFLNDGEYKAEQSADDPDIFVFESPYFTYAQFCSPCAPGAGYLMNPLNEPDENNKTYCFGHDWFENGKAPYPVYSVKTGELIEPVKE